MAGVKCEGGDIYARAVALIATTQFAFLTADEAQARTSDPLVPGIAFRSMPATTRALLMAAS